MALPDKQGGGRRGGKIYRFFAQFPGLFATLPLPFGYKLPNQTLSNTS
jgi:hypothetical protein